jgi:N,N'-diacetylbacillosaminyl-diphospho-undecaprenol alpha-1,3-N-acetylgalactosaminyltransferase
VTTDVVGCRETVDEGVNGFLIPAKNALALADAIESLINNKDLRHRMGEKSRIKAMKEFDVDKIVDKHLEVYGLQNVR